MLFFSIVALALVLIDWFDLARDIEVRVRLFMKHLWKSGLAIFRAGNSIVGTAGSVATAFLLLIGVVATLLGKEVPAGFRMVAELFVYVPLLLGMAMLLFYGVLWLLTRFKKGVLASLGLLFLALSVIVEIVR